MDSVDCLSGGSRSVILDDEQPCSNAITAQSKRVKLLNILQKNFKLVGKDVWRAETSC